MLSRPSARPRPLPLLVTATFGLFALALSCGDETDSDTSTGGSGGNAGHGGTASGGTGGTTTAGNTAGASGAGGAAGGTGGTKTGGITGGSGGTGDAAGSGGTGGQTTPDAGTGGAGDRPDASGSDAAPTSPAVQLRGRFDHTDTPPTTFGWAGSAMVARFNGTGVTIQLSGSDDRYQIVIDGTPTSVLKVTASGKYEVAKGLPSGTHEMELWRRTESNWSQSSYLGIEVTGGQLLAPPARPDRRIEIYGDSITAGYGVDGAGPNCSVSQDNSNNYLSYGSVAARALSAELHTVAWSGIGMYRGYGETTPAANSMTMPKVYDRIMPYAPASPVIDNAWDFASWQPHAVVINLGTNDASSKGDPGMPYRTAYLDFVRGLRGKYPNAFFVLSIGPMLDGESLKAIRTHLQEVMKTRASEGDTKMSYLEFPVQVQADGFGCDWHPSAKTQAKMADVLIAELKKQLSW